MPARSLALSQTPPEPAADADYEAIYAAVASTARGRWFLAEFARRDRGTDLAQVLAAIARMEGAVLSERAQHAERESDQQIHIELLEMARAIARTRADMAESGPAPPAAGSTGAGTANIAAAADRLRQIAWTMRACNVELAASDQIGQIADTILAAEAARGLDADRSHKLAEALYYLEHRIERMLDTRLPVPAAAEIAETEAAPARKEPPPVSDNASVASIDPVGPEAVATATDAAPLSIAESESPALPVSQQPISQQQAGDSAPLAEPRAEASTAAAHDPIAQQVERDLDGLTDGDGNDEADPAKLLLETPAVAAPAPAAPAPAADVSAAGAQTVHAKPATALAEIANELRTAPTTLRAKSPPTKPADSAPTKPTMVADGPLAALMVMSEEERVALFS